MEIRWRRGTRRNAVELDNERCPVRDPALCLQTLSRHAHTRIATALHLNCATHAYPGLHVPGCGPGERIVWSRQRGNAASIDKPGRRSPFASWKLRPIRKSQSLCVADGNGHRLDARTEPW